MRPESLQQTLAETNQSQYEINPNIFEYASPNLTKLYQTWTTVINLITIWVAELGCRMNPTKLNNSE